MDKIKTKKILYISSADPTIRSGTLAMDDVNALRKYGYEVDFLTKYKVHGHEDILSVYPYYEDNKPFIQKLFRLCKLPFKAVRKVYRKLTGYENKFHHTFFYKDDTKPPVSNKALLSAIPEGNEYDLIMILFWQEMMSISSLEALYEKYHSHFIISCADYSPMTGGCHFIGDCKQFEKGCGCCPEFKSNNSKDITFKNACYKKMVYEKIRPVFLMNHYMNDNYGSRGPVIAEQRKVMSFVMINEEEFCPRDKKLLRKELGVPEDKKVLFFASQSLNDPRKGIKYVIEGLKEFKNSLTEDEFQNVFVVTAGAPNAELLSKIPFEYKSFGFVDIKTLSKIFSLSDLYLSGSVIDAGPMMVNQALSCGVPVIAFQIGTALEVVKDQGTGYCALTADSKDFAKGIKWYYDLSEDEYNSVSKKCREVALKTTSRKACVDLIKNISWD